MRKPRIAILRGPLLNPFEMQNYELLQDEFDLVALTPHQTQFDTSQVHLPKEVLRCPIADKIPFERPRRKFQAAKEILTGDTFSFCGMRDRLQGFDLYHIKDQSFCFSYEAALAKKRHGGKLIVTQMENIPRLNEQKWMERHIKETVRKEADLFLAASEGAVATLLEEGVSPEKIGRIANAVNVQQFHPADANLELRRSLGVPDKAFLVLYVGRLHTHKGVFTLLEAMKKLHKEANIHLLMVGKDEENVRGWISQQGLEAVVHLMDFVPYAQMPQYYQAAQLFVLPSLPAKRWKEQFGYVLIEAMACGIPVIGADSGAIPEVVGSPSMVFPAGSVLDLAYLVKTLSRRSIRSEGIRVRKRAVDLYSSRVLSENLRRAYRQVLGLRVLPKRRNSALSPMGIQQG